VRTLIGAHVTTVDKRSRHQSRQVSLPKTVDGTLMKKISLLPHGSYVKYITDSTRLKKNPI
jgi:hypothetical protein